MRLAHRLSTKIILIISALILMLLPITALSQSNINTTAVENKNPRVAIYNLNSIADAQRLAIAATSVFRSVAAQASITPNILERAEVIAVFPGYYRFGPVFPGGFGNGVVTVREAQTGRWSEPIFISLSLDQLNSGENIDEKDAPFDLILIGIGRNAAHDFLSQGAHISTGVKPSAGVDKYPVNQIIAYQVQQDGISGFSFQNGLLWQAESINNAIYLEPLVVRTMPVSQQFLRNIKIFSDTVHHYTNKQGV